MNKELNKAYLKVREFLAENGYEGIGFDLRSYDDAEDIPHITFNRERRNISYIRLAGKDYMRAVFSPYWHETYVSINDMDNEELYQLLNNIFMETQESQDYLDFDDFLGL